MNKFHSVIKKEIYILIGLVAVFSLIPILSAKAGSLSSITITPANTLGNRTDNYTIGFTTATTILAASTTKVALTFPNGFSVASAATTTDVTTGLGNRVLTTMSVLGQVITLNLTATSTDSTAGAATIVLSTITSPIAGGSFTVAVATQDEDATTIDSGTSAAFIIVAAVVPSTAAGKSYNINFSANPSEGGIVPPNGSYTEGTSIMVNAVPKSGYVFLSWEENGVEISKQSTYSFTVTAKRGLVARFKAVEAKATPEEATPAVSAVSEEKPISQMTAQEIQAKIIEIQQKLIILIQELIKLLQAQL